MGEKAHDVEQHIELAKGDTLDVGGVSINLPKIHELASFFYGRDLPLVKFGIDRSLSELDVASYDIISGNIYFNKTSPNSIAVAYEQCYRWMVGERNSNWIDEEPPEQQAKYYEHSLSTEALMESRTMGQNKSPYDLINIENGHFLRPSMERYKCLLQKGLKEINELPSDEREKKRDAFISKHMERFKIICETSLRTFYAGAVLHELSHAYDFEAKQGDYFFQPQTGPKFDDILWFFQCSIIDIWKKLDDCSSELNENYFLNLVVSSGRSFFGGMGEKLTEIQERRMDRFVTEENARLNKVKANLLESERVAYYLGDKYGPFFKEAFGIDSNTLWGLK